MQTLKENKRRLRFSNSIFLLIGFAVYYLSLNYAYTDFMLTKWGYDYLETSWGIFPSENQYYFGEMVYVLSAIVLSFTMTKKPSDFVHFFGFLTPITPMIIIANHKEVGEVFASMCALAFFTSYFISKLPFRAPIIRLKNPIVNEKNFMIGSVVLGVLIISLSIAFGGLEWLNFDFDEVYNFRRDASDTRGVLLNYLLLNYVGILMPLSIALTLKLRAHWLLFVLILVNIMTFGLTSNKSYLFVFVVTIAMYRIGRTRNPQLLVALGVSGVCFISVALYMLNENWDTFGTLFVRRFFFVPAYANFQYWEFFSYSPFALWSDSKVSLGLIEPVYAVRTPLLIADYYSGVDFSNRVDRFSSSNTGWFGAGFGNAGYYGLFIYSVLSGIITKYANILVDKVGARVATAGITFYFFTVFFTSTDLPAAMLSYGMLVLIVVLNFWGDRAVVHHNERLVIRKYS